MAWFKDMTVALLSTVLSQPAAGDKFGTRYYDPAVGRWTQQDPVAGSIGDPRTVNRYVYVGDNPVNFVDPGGDKWWQKALVGFGKSVLVGSTCFAVGAATAAVGGFACGVILGTAMAALPGPK
jgi:RHS repeat-associated protein